MLGALETVQGFLEHRRQGGGLLDQVVVGQQLQGRQAGGAGNRVAGVGVAVAELDHVLRSRLLHEGVVDLAGGDHCAQRDGTVGDLLGGVHDVRGHAEVFGTGPFTHAPKRRDHFVEDQQDVVLGADLAQALQVALGRHDHTGGTGHRLDDHGGDVGRIMQFDQLEQLVGQLHATGFGHALGEGQVRLQGVRQVVGVHHLAEHLAVAADAAEAGAGDVHAVVATGTADELGLARLALQAPVGTRHLHGGVGALGARTGVEHVVEAGRGQLGDLFGQQVGQRMAVLEARGVVEGAQLTGDRFLNLGAVVAGAAGPQARQAVEHATALVVDEVVAFGPDNDARVALEVAVGGERHPVSVELQLVGKGRGSFRQCHGSYLAQAMCSAWDGRAVPRVAAKLPEA